MDQFAKHALVRSKAICRIEATGSRAAQPAAALLIERKRIQEGRPAAHAEILGGHGKRTRETPAAHRNARELGQCRFANAAFVGENKRKEAVRNLLENGGKSYGET